MYNVIRSDNGKTVESVERSAISDAIAHWYGQGVPVFARPVSN